MGTTVTVTAVSTVNDTLSATAHGLVSGDRFRLRNIGGALPAATPSLSDDADVYAIRVDANTLKVATSSANALTGTAVDITGVGTGTHYVTYGLPLVVPRVAAALTQVMPADDNAQWEALVALNRLLTGRTQAIWDSAVSLAGALTVGGNVTLAANQHVTVSGTGRYKHGDMIQNVPPLHGSGTGWAWDATNGYLLSSGAGTWSVGIPTIVGWRVKSITFERYGDGAADLSGNIQRRPKNSTPDTPFAIGATNAAASWTDDVYDFTDKDISDGDSFWIDFTANAANLRIGEIRVTYSRP